MIHHETNDTKKSSTEEKTLPVAHTATEIDK